MSPSDVWRLTPIEATADSGYHDLQREKRPHSDQDGSAFFVYSMDADNMDD